VKFTRETPATLTIHSVSDHEIRIGDAVYRNPIALTIDAVSDDWPAKVLADLVADDFSRLLNDNPEIIVLGTGKEIQFPPRELVFAMARRGVGFEVMDTRAAARTFNVLAGEDRRVAAVLYIGI